eukprot:965950-Ditylum_brightwellii.AAC.1
MERIKTFGTYSRPYQTNDLIYVFAIEMLSSQSNHAEQNRESLQAVASRAMMIDPLLLLCEQLSEKDRA